MFPIRIARKLCGIQGLSVQVSGLMCANWSSADENDERFGATSKLTTASDTGGNAACSKARLINKFHGNCVCVFEAQLIALIDNFENSY